MKIAEFIEAARHVPVPRRRGDEPANGRVGSSPGANLLFPAGAGMNRVARGRFLPRGAGPVPRRRGDEPLPGGLKTHSTVGSFPAVDCSVRSGIVLCWFQRLPGAVVETGIPGKVRASSGALTFISSLSGPPLIPYRLPHGGFFHLMQSGRTVLVAVPAGAGMNRAWVASLTSSAGGCSPQARG